ncbi:hypothetical protein AAE478_002970 [Parahypoxylon ruwenzoriense]
MLIGGKYPGRHDPHRCRALLHDGAWSPLLASGGFRKWEPRDCRMVQYPPDALRDCLGGRTVVFAGDSTIRQIFWAAAKRLDPGRAKHEITDMVSASGKHQDFSFKANGIRVEFIWDPWLNSTALDNTLKKFRSNSPSLNEIIAGENNEGSAALIILGAPGLWATRYGGNDYLDLFNRGISGIIPYLSPSLDDDVASSTLTARGFDNTPNQILLAPVQVPEYSSLSPNRSRTITPERIKGVNNYLSQLSPAQSSHIIWAYNKMSADPGGDFDEDGLHVSNNVAARKLDIALNAYCNSAARAYYKRSFKGTCCVADRGICLSLQPTTILLTTLFIWSCVFFYMPSSRYQSWPRLQLPIRHSTTILYTLVVCWFHDATTEIGKLERHYKESDFIKTCLVWLVASVLSLRKSVHRPTEKQSLTTTDKSKREPPGYRGPGYLSRDHSDEIKGLMQGFILLYHYHHASQTLWVYKTIRLFISGYFYLSGYGHATHLLKTNDFSARRMAAVLFRLNVLSALLPYVMGTTYASYYFASAITFWYLVLYGTLRFIACYNRNIWWIVAKVVFAATWTNWMTSAPGLLEAFARVSRAVFGMSWDAEELRFRLRLDRYIVFVGAVVAALVHNASIRRARSRSLATLGHARFSSRPKHAVLLNTLCVMAIFAFFHAAQTHLRQKQSYNHVHPLISWIPILSFVVLRNSLSSSSSSSSSSFSISRGAPGGRGGGRGAYYLALPAALGPISLETYVLQYHMWLGGDATARLTLGLGGVPGGPRS